MSLCKDCFTGVRHEGEAEGKFERLGGEEVYIGTPSGEYPKDKVLLYLPDAFGMPLINNQLQVDAFARNGFKTVGVEYFRGNAIPGLPEEADWSTFDVQGFMGKVRPGTRPCIDNVIAALKEQGITSFAAIGFCYGARYVFDLAFDNVIKVAAVSHPSLLQAPEDLENYATKSKAPLLINSCEIDRSFPKEAQEKADEILGGGKFAPGYERTYWDGCTHGFAVRGDLNNPKVKAGKEGSFKASVEFMMKYL